MGTPQDFSAPRLESFKKSGVSLFSPGSTATTSFLKGPCANTSLYESPKAKAQNSSSDSSGSSDEEQGGEEMKKKKVEGIKKLKEGERTQSSSSESLSESDSRPLSDSSDYG